MDITTRTTDPTVSDDSSAGFIIGDFIFNSEGGEVFLAGDVSVGSASWIRLGSFLDTFTTISGIDITTLSGLDDVDTTGIVENDILKWNGTNFVPTGFFADGGEPGEGARTLGNTDGNSLGFLTNNIERVQISGSGSFVYNVIDTNTFKITDFHSDK